MIILYFIIALAVVTFIGLLLSYKSGKLTDKDGDFIPDELEQRVERVKQELNDVKEAVKEVGNQLGDIPSAVKGKTRTGRKPKK